MLAVNFALGIMSHFKNNFVTMMEIFVSRFFGELMSTKRKMNESDGYWPPEKVPKTGTDEFLDALTLLEENPLVWFSALNYAQFSISLAIHKYR